MESKNEKPREWVIDSHRGAFKEGALENSIESYTISYQQGANMMETDLRLTKDKQIVLIHNNTIDHLMKDAIQIPQESEFHEIPTGPVKNHTLAFLKAVKFQNCQQILTLTEFCDFLKKYKVGAQIELKEGGYEDQILKTIEGAHIDYESLSGPVVCSSFNAFAVRRLVKKASKYQIPYYRVNEKQGLAFGMQGIPLGAFYGKAVLRWCGRNHIWGFTTYYKYLPISRISYAHAQGVKFCPRLPDDENLVNRYIDNGVDGFETDNVPFIRACIEKKGYQLPPLPQ